MNWRNANEVADGIQGPGNIAHGWKKPAKGRLQLNTDAAIHAGSRTTSFGWVIRDHEGSFVPAKSVCMEGVCQPKEAKALSLREALSWLKEMEIDDEDVEMDA